MHLSPREPTAERQALCEQHNVAETVTTREAARMLGLQPQSLLRWSCYGSGPIKPVRVGRLLRWRVADIQAVLNGRAASAP